MISIALLHGGGTPSGVLQSWSQNPAANMSYEDRFKKL